MEFTIKVHRPGWWPSRVPRWARPLVLVLTLVIGVPVVLATDRFADVPPGIHHDDITRLASAGVTVGCGLDVSGNPIYCPSAAVNREQMASFLVRGLGRIAEGGWQNVVVEATSTFASDSVEIQTGIPATATTSSGFLLVNAFANISNNSTGRCIAQVSAFLLQSGVQLQDLKGGLQHVEAGTIANVSLTRVVEVGSGTYEVEVFAGAHNGAGQGCDAVVNGSINVMYIPFDGNANNND